MEPVSPWRRAVTGLVVHGSGRTDVPEGTLYAYHHGLAAGADAIEVDVQGTIDGVPVVVHDDDLARITGVERAVDTVTLEGLQAMDPAHQAPEFAGVATGEVEPPGGFGPEHFRVPTLDEVFEAFPGVPIVLDLKASAPTEAVADVVRRWGRGADVLVGSFDAAKTRAVASRLPEVATAPGADQVTAFLSGVDVEGWDAFAVPVSQDGRRVVDESFVRRAHAADMGVLVWNVNDRREVERLIEWRVDLVVTDVPAKLAPMVRRQVNPAAVRAAFVGEEE